MVKRVLQGYFFLADVAKSSQDLIIIVSLESVASLAAQFEHRKLLLVEVIVGWLWLWLGISLLQLFHL